jgi:hypothetical protein
VQTSNNRVRGAIPSSKRGTPQRERTEIQRQNEEECTGEFVFMGDAASYIGGGFSQQIGLIGRAHGNVKETCGGDHDSFPDKLNDKCGVSR